MQRIFGMEKLTYKQVTQLYSIEAFYLADRQDEYIVDDIIAGWTSIFPCNWFTPPVSHEERGLFVDGQLMFFSSTSRNELGATKKKKNGTRWIDAHTLLRHPERWVLLKSPKMKKFDIVCEIKRANSILGMLYDFVGVVLDFVRVGLLFNKRKKIYCSKTCHYMHLNRFSRISPKRRYKLLIEKYGYKEISIDEVFDMENYSSIPA